MRTRIPVIAVLGAALLLTGCTASGDALPSDHPSTGGSAAPVTCATSGSASDSIQVAGDIGSKPTATIPSPVSVDETERTVVSAGDGVEAAEGDMVTLDYTLYNGTTGAELDATSYAEGGHATFIVDAEAYLTGLVESVACSTVGSRVVAVIPPADAFSTTGNESLGIGADDSIVFVLDVLAVDATRATGADQPPVDGMPTVELAEDGTPTVTVPTTDPPTTLQTAVLKKGDGEVVESGDQVVLQYQGVIWATGAVFDQSWGAAEPSVLGTGDVIPGFRDALVGQTVGSQVIAVIPPDQGYGSTGNSTAGISGTDTLVFVIDILRIDQ